MLSSYLKGWFQGDAGRLLCPWRKTSFIRRPGLLKEDLPGAFKACGAGMRAGWRNPVLNTPASTITSFPPA